jgi:CubicO group peptidase (beta-lactamase class C family)
MSPASVDFFAESVLDGEAWSRSWQQDLSNPDLVDGAPATTELLGNRIFDLASLTKVISTGSLLVETAELDGAKTLREWSSHKLSVLLPELAGTPLESLTIRECWEHRSGLPAFLEFSFERRGFHTLNQRPQVHAAILAQAVADAKKSEFVKTQGTTLYSDLGYSLLGIYLERRHNRTQDLLWEAWKKKHLARRAPESVASLRYNVENARREGAVATEVRHEAGQVNDNNTYGMGGVAPHAGLFGTALDVAHWIEAALAWARLSPLAREWMETPAPESQRFVFGWDTPSPVPESQAGGLAAAPGVRGHLGYTGTALWLDPALLRFGVLLTNRVHPAHTPESQKSIQKLRRWCFESLWRGTLEAGWKTSSKTGVGLIS